jgi:D-arabinose 1-dehydrogenase-like Zn-dependent alcohol dehydrogenase
LIVCTLIRKLLKLFFSHSNGRYEDGGVAYGGYSEAVRVSEDYAFILPEGLPSDVAAPLLCAGATVFNPMRRYKFGPQHTVAVVGIGTQISRLSFILISYFGYFISRSERYRIVLK